MTETLCVHCGIMRDEKLCNANPYINAEPRTYCKLAPTPTYKANQISGPTAETLAMIAHTAEKFDVAVIVTETGLVLRSSKGSHSMVSTLNWLQLTHANDPHGMCAVMIGRIYRALQDSLPSLEGDS